MLGARHSDRSVEDGRVEPALERDEDPARVSLDWQAP
jgi:hypothetical protein